MDNYIVDKFISSIGSFFVFDTDLWSSYRGTYNGLQYIRVGKSPFYGKRYYQWDARQGHGRTPHWQYIRSTIVAEIPIRRIPIAFLYG